MIPSSYYFPIYIGIIWILLIINLISGIDRGTLVYRESKNKNEFVKAFILATFLVIYFGFRPDGSEMADTVGYRWYYNSIKDGTLPKDYGYGPNMEYAWWWLRKFYGDIGLSSEVWFTTIAAINLYTMLFAIHKLYPGNEYLGYLFFLTAFGTYGGCMNGIRNADAMSIFIFALTVIIQQNNSFSIKNKIYILFLIIISYEFHHSVIMLITGYIISKFFIKNTKLAFAIWCLTIIFTLLFGSSLANYISGLGIDSRSDSYLNDISEETLQHFSRVGFRWDFLLFSAVPILFGLYIINYTNNNNNKFSLILNNYIFTNAIWIVFIYSAFSNRYAALSWCLYPIVISYPLIKFDNITHRNLLIGIFLFFQLSFSTLF